MNNSINCLVNGDPEVSNWYSSPTYTYGHYCVPPTTTYWTTTYVPFIEDKTKKAFAIAKKLVKSKFMKAEKVSDFIELVEMIEKEL